MNGEQLLDGWTVNNVYVMCAFYFVVLSMCRCVWFVYDMAPRGETKQAGSGLRKGVGGKVGGKSGNTKWRRK